MNGLDEIFRFLTFGVTAVMIALLVYYWRRIGREDRYREEGRCLTCGYDLRASRERCPECGTPVKHLPVGAKLDVDALRDDWPASPIVPRKVDAGEAWVEVFDTDLWFEADLLRHQLQARGIGAMLVRPYSVAGTSDFGPAQRYFSVQVYAGDRALAREYIDRLRRTDVSVSENDVV